MADHTTHDRDGDVVEAEDDEELDQGYKTVKDAVLFAIDVSATMLKQPEFAAQDKKADRDSATAAALKCAYQLMQQRIISNPNDLMGILLFGTEQSKFQDGNDSAIGTYQYPHCYLLADLDIPAAEDVKRLRSLIEDEREAASLLKPSSDSVSMSNVLFCANQVFMTRAPNFSSRRLFLVTDNDNPHAQSKELRSSAVVRAKDLYDLGVTIELFPISQPGHDFDTTKFYDDIVYRSPMDPEAPAPVSKASKASSSADGISLLTSLLSSIHSKIVPKRALFSNVSFELDPELKISVKGYIVFKRQIPKRAGFVYLEGEVPVLAEGKTTRMTEDSARALEQVDIFKAYRFGGDYIKFTLEEQDKMTHFGDPVIRIIGFKPISMLPFWANCKPSTFIYPSEEAFVGSTRTFSALQQTLLKTRKMGLVWYIARKNAAPVIAALLPGAEEVGELGDQTMPPGMWLCPLPFRDDIREWPEMNKVIRSPDALTDHMRDVVGMMHLPGSKYVPARYPNPALQWHYKILQAMALDEDVPTQPEDKTLPRYKAIRKRAGKLLSEWNETLEQEYVRWRSEHGSLQVAVKRERAPSTNESQPKKVKSSQADLPSEHELRTTIAKHNLGKYTVVILKGICDRHGLVSNGNKTILVDRIEDFFDDKMNTT